MATEELGKVCVLEGKNTMPVGNEENNLGRKRGAYKNLVYCAFPNVWLHLANLGQSLFFSIIITYVSAGIAWPSPSQA